MARALKSISLTVPIGLGYGLLGAIGLTLAIPPGYASPVFPAAGLALVCLLRYGPRALPGVLLGSFGLNAGHAWLGGTLDARTTAVAMLIACGASVQAWAGHLLVMRYQAGTWQKLERERDVFYFLLLGGVLACLFAASISVTSLGALGIIAREEYVYTWWTWYVGDAMGVLVFAPMAMCLLYRSEPIWRQRLRSLSAPMLVLMALATLVFAIATRWERDQYDSQLRMQSESLATRISDALITHREVLHSLHRFVEAVPDMSPDQFEQFTAGALQNNPEIESLTYADVVPDPERERFESQAGTVQPIVERGEEGYARAARRPEYVPVLNTISRRGHEFPVGFDLNAEPVVQAALRSARRSNDIALSAPLPGELSGESSTLLEVLAVDRHVAPLGDPATTAPQQTLVGFAMATVPVRDLVEAATRDRLPAGLELRISDADIRNGSHPLLYLSDSSHTAGVRHDASPRWETTLQAGDRSWQVAVVTTQAYVQTHRPMVAWLVGVVALAFATLLQVLMLGMSGRAAIMRRKNLALQASEDNLRRTSQDLLLAKQATDAAYGRLTATLDAIPDLLFEIDGAGHYLDVKSSRDALLAAPKDTLVGRRVEEVLPPASARVVMQAVQAAAEHGTDYGRLMPLALPDGDRWFELSLARKAGAGGDANTYIVISRDVTERRRVQAELEQHKLHLESAVEARTAEMQQARLAAEDAARAKSVFLANMSHEIRTPLNAVTGFTHLLARTPLSGEQREHIGKIQDASRHLLLIVNDILDLSKIEAGKLALEQTDFSLHDILAEVRTQIAGPAEAKGITIELDHQSAPPWLRGDPTRLRQAMLNYAGNAMKFTERGTITLRTRLLDERDGRVLLRFEVADTGIGIAADKIATLFQPFHQIDASTTRRFGGTGLGLAITQRIAELMEGQAGAESVEGAGSTFWFTAWIGRGQPVEVRHTEDTSDREDELRQRHSGKRILLAEDNAVNQIVAKALLERTGLKVEVAVNGREALARCSDGYALILMDVHMPEMDGLEATRAIRTMPGCRDLPILAMTADAFTEDRQRCFDAGMNDFISKPVAPRELYDLLAKWLDARSAGATPA